MPEKIKILIPFSSTLNTGDAGILISTLNSIKREFGESATVLVASHQKAIAEKFYPEINYMDDKINFNDRLFKSSKTLFLRNYLILFLYRIFGIIPGILLTGHEKKLKDEILKADIILAPGGGYLTDSYFMQFNLALFDFILKKEKRLYFYSQSIGPFWRWTTKKFLKNPLHKAGLVILRDAESLEHIKKLLGKKPDNIFESADEAFTYRQPEFNKSDNNGHVGISVRDWNFSNSEYSSDIAMNNYKTNLKKTCEFLVDEYNYDITFISTCQGNKEYRDDSKLAVEIFDMIDSKYQKKITVIRDYYTLDYLVDYFKHFDFFIGTRMHSIIFNFLNLTPCLGIVYEFKTSELFKRIGLDNYIFEMYSDDFDLLKTKIIHLIKNLEKITEQLSIEIPKLRNLALNNMRLVKEDYYAQKQKKVCEF
jgi:colanic acid/amylovoran biosynthesis protein